MSLLSSNTTRREAIIETAYLVLRVGVSFLFVFHAPQKLLGLYGSPRFPLISLRGAGSVIEAVCSPLIALGLFTSYAAVVAAIEMAGAYIVVHMNMLPRPSWPIENRGELAVLYFFVFVFIAAAGGGRYSLDRMRRRRGPRGHGPPESAS